MEVGSALKASMWTAAEQAYGPNLQSLIEQALAEYKRQPGLDDLTRLHASMAGQDGLIALRSALSKRMPEMSGCNRGNYLELRRRLRWHIVWHLQQRLIEDGCATAAMRDDYLGTDLGL
ncbi:hypothetical protein XJ28_27340 [Pseudomonas syringae pv. tomato]|uniref:hypothetical protein n=1 Tax=Pseudomonas syringae group TaxID=136849 RepID=UPI000D224A66|nr:MULTISPECIES: hypothetical protein [Pseudomonas syringae group]AVI87160.1 hypothetical protein XJ28_27340 [Pseudomonas syringae pv. tomato]QBI61055.1 hypothetical protein EIZ61_05970 [Pseudomonas syringae]